MLKRFYAKPPKSCNHKWIIRRYDQKYQECEHEIVDVGIMDLLKPPHKYSPEMLEKWGKTKTRGWLVVPDCFDLKGEKGINVDFDTIEYSKKLLLRYYSGESRLMPVIQCRSGDLKSVYEYCVWLWSMYDPKIIGVSGTIGRSRDREFMYKSLQIIRAQFPDAWIHVFGLHKYNLIYKDTFKLIDSYDSSAWTIKPNGWRKTKNNQDRAEFFERYRNQLIKDMKRKMGEYYG